MCESTRAESGASGRQLRHYGLWMLAVLAPLVLLAGLALPADAQAAPRLFVYGDSLAVRTEKYIPRYLEDWRIRQDVGDARRTRDAVRVLRRRERLAPVIHLSVGSVDDPLPGLFRRRVRKVMRIVGPERCVVWANIWRPAPKGEPGWRPLNRVLAEEASRRRNLIVVDWYSMAKANPKWMEWDGVHPYPEGERARSRAVADAARTCDTRLG